MTESNVIDKGVNVSFGCIDVHISSSRVRGVGGFLRCGDARHTIRVEFGGAVLAKPVHYIRRGLSSDQVLSVLRQVALSAGFILALPVDGPGA